MMVMKKYLWVRAGFKREINVQNSKYYAIFLSIYYFYIHDVHKDLIEFLFNRNRYYPRNSSIYIRVQFRHRCSLKLVKKKKKGEKKAMFLYAYSKREFAHSCRWHHFEPLWNHIICNQKVFDRSTNSESNWTGFIEY